LGRGGYHLKDMDHCGASFKKKIIMVCEPIYLEIINTAMVGFANTTAREILEHLFLYYCRITAVDLDHNSENTRNAWDPQQSADTLFNKIQFCVNYA
jgi:hypothetical protein